MRRRLHCIKSVAHGELIHVLFGDSVSREPSDGTHAAESLTGRSACDADRSPEPYPLVIGRLIDVITVRLSFHLSPVSHKKVPDKAIRGAGRSPELRPPPSRGSRSRKS